MSTSLDRRSLLTLTLTAAAVLPKLSAAKTAPAGENTIAHLRSETQALLDGYNKSAQPLQQYIMSQNQAAATVPPDSWIVIEDKSGPGGRC